MKKPIKLSTNYIIKTLYNQELYYFTLKDIASLFNIPIKRAYTLAIRLKDKDLIRPIERSKYLLLGFEPERVLSNLDKRGRDLYDLWFLLEGGVEVDIELINSKLSLYGRSYSSENTVNCIASMKNNWTKDLKTLLGSPVPYEVAAGLVVDRLNMIQ